jgi:hypothetical protein
LVSNPGWGGLLGSIERCFELVGRDVVAVTVEAAGVEPVPGRFTASAMRRVNLPRAYLSARVLCVLIGGAFAEH